jgi:hypothetical protein
MRRARALLIDWRFGGLLLAAAAFALYGPAANRVFAVDQLWYFAELGGDSSLAAGLTHLDYAVSRVYWKGDDLLFRPLLFAWLAIANWLFTYHHVGWNLASVAIHAAAATALLRLLLAIRPSPFALPAAAVFLVLEPSVELVLWQHLGGYLLACVWLLAGLTAFVRILEGSTGWRHDAVFAAAFTLGSLTYEAVVPIAAAAAAVLLWRRRLPASRVLLLVSPLALFTVLYIGHALRVPQIDYVDRDDGQRLFGVANLLASAPGALHMLAVWARELALPSALEMSAEPFQRFAKRFAVSWNGPQIANLLVVLASLALTATMLSLKRLREAAPLGLPLAAGIVAYAALIAFGRAGTEAAATTYYAYVPAVLLAVLVYALADPARAGRWKRAAGAVLLAAFGSIHAAGTAGIVEEVRRVNRSPSLYLTRVIDFVDAHKDEPGFSFTIEPHPESLDPKVRLREGYPNNPSAKHHDPLVTEILFARYYDPVRPKYVLSASAERVVQQ